MKQVNSLKFWHGLLFMLMMVSFTACVDDNEDTEAPFLEVNPATLTFENGGVQTLEISTNRQWKATVEDADWISLSKTQGEGSDQIQVSVPEGTIGEAKINIIMSNRSGILKSATVNVKAGTVIESKLIYNETLGNADASQKPYISDYQGWNKSGDGATSVEYAGNKTSIRSSGLTNTDAYEGASGPNVVFFGTAPATFDINKIALAEGQTNLKLTFGASRSKKNEDNSFDNSFTPETFKVSVSSNGTTWQEITYEKNNGDADHPYWILATANFTLKKAVPELYIRFTASESSVFRLDDISLSTGYGGQEVNLEEGTTTPPEEGSGTAINKIINLQKGGQTKLTENMEFEAIVCGDPKVNNASAGTLNLMTPNATAANEGIVLYNGALNEQIQTNFSLGDKVKVSLKADKVKLGNYNGTTQITDWEISDVTVVSRNNAVVPIQTTTDKLAEYAGMPATISNVTISEAGVWEAKTYNFGDLTVHFNKNATSIVGQPYKAGTGSITGIVTVFKEKAQLMPRNLEDLKDFISNEPAINVNPENLSFASSGGEKSVEVQLANIEGEITATGLDAQYFTVSVSGNTVTVKAKENATANAITGKLVISSKNAPQVSATVEVTIAPQVRYELIDNMDKLSAGKYLLSGYIEEYSGTTYAPYSYQIWTGEITSGKNIDLVTKSYEFTNETLNPKDEAIFNEVELISVPDKANTYYIKTSNKYLYSTSGANRKLGLTEDPANAEWVFSNLNTVGKPEAKGITATNNGVYIVTAGAESNHLRSYAKIANYDYGMYFFKKKK